MWSSIWTGFGVIIARSTLCCEPSYISSPVFLHVFILHWCYCNRCCSPHIPATAGRAHLACCFNR